MSLQHPDIHDPGIQHEPPNNSHLPDAQIRLHKTYLVLAHRGDGHAGHNDINAVAFQCRDEFFPGEFDKSDGAPSFLTYTTRYIGFGRCFRAVDLMLDGSPELITVDKQSNDRIVHTLRLRKADRAAHQPLDPLRQVDVLALDSLHVLLTNDVFLSIHMTLIGPPAVCAVPGDTKRLQQGLKAEKDLVLTPSEHRGQDLSCVMVDGVP